MEMNIEEIRQILPHRFPFLLIDRVTACEPGVSAEAIKCVSANEPFFQGHFPQEAVMPGVLILEALAQTGAAAMLVKEENRGKIAYFGGVKNARFRGKVIPGDVLHLRCEIEKQYGKVGFGKAEASVDGKIVAQAELSFALSD